MSKPPVPPRPVDDRPPVPPLPPDLRYDIAAPRPQKLDPSLPANMAQSLDDSMYRVNPNPGFAFPQPMRGPSPLPPPQGTEWQAWTSPNHSSYSPPKNYQPIDQSFANLSFSSTSPSLHPRAPSVASTYGPPPKAPSPPRPAANSPSLTAPLPTLPTLLQALSAIQLPSHDPALKVAWCRDVFFLVDRAQHNTSTDAAVGPVTVSDPQLARLAQIAVPLILQISSPRPPPNPLPLYVAEAVYHRATFEASGAYPEHIRQDPRSAFRDFEAAARAGHHVAWFRLGRDYENFNDFVHAKDCFERGVKLGVESCTYRMGMAHLMGQLGLPANPDLAVPLLHRAATLASLEVPQPAYVYALLLLSEFSHITLPPAIFAPYIPSGSSTLFEARKHLERAAYLHFPPAQYKLGHAYEFAQPPFPFDALLSVQYYSLASQQGEVEADMALSKWFLCGAEGAFDKDESLAWTFADKAARKGLPSAMFAMGYYAEVGVGGPKDIDAAVKWYNKAADLGNQDAKERLAALSQPAPQTLSRQEHDAITENKLVRRRTQAKQRSETLPHHQQPAPLQRPDGQQVLDHIRKNSAMTEPHRRPHQHHTMPTESRPQTGPSVPPPGARPPTSSGPGVGPRPGTGGRQFSSSHRYTLTDPGSSPPPPQPNEPAKPPTPRPQKGPATFAEMGIQGVKAEDKECVIM